MSQHIEHLNGLPGFEEAAQLIYKGTGNFFPAIVYVYDIHSSRLRFINRDLTDLLGYDLREFEDVENGLLQFVHAEDVNRMKEEIKKFLFLKADESHSFDIRLMHKGGAVLNFRHSGIVLSRDESKRPASLLFMAQEINRPIDYTEQHASSRELLDEIEKLLQFGSWSWHIQTNKVEWSDGLYDLLEYRRGAMEPVSNEFYLRHITPEHGEKFQKLLSDAVERKNGFEYEYIINTAKGTQKLVSTKIHCLTDAEGQVKRVVGVTRDITSVRNFDKERERMIRELNRSNKELEEFAYVASHDLQEPLRKVVAFSQRLKNKFNGALGEEGNLYLERITASTERMRTLIDNLLEFSKISRPTSSFVRCDLRSVIAEVLTDLDLRIEETATTVTIGAMPVIEVIPAEMKQLFFNLIANALKFRKKDTPAKIDIRSEKLNDLEKATLYLDNEKLYYRIDVQDNGIGFDSSYAEKIFEIFQRLHGKSEYAGSGIGLAICKKIVDNYDGVIYANSIPGEGSTFTIILPEQQP